MLSGRKIRAVNKGTGLLSGWMFQSLVVGAAGPVACSLGDRGRRLPEQRWQMSPDGATVGPVQAPDRRLRSLRNATKSNRNGKLNTWQYRGHNIE